MATAVVPGMCDPGTGTGDGFGRARQIQAVKGPATLGHADATARDRLGGTANPGHLQETSRVRASSEEDNDKAAGVDNLG